MKTQPQGRSGRRGERRAWGQEDNLLKIASVCEAQGFASLQMSPGSSGTLQGVQRSLNPLKLNRGGIKVSSVLKDCCKSRANRQGVKDRWDVSSCFTALQRPRSCQWICQGWSEIGLLAVVFILSVPRLPGDKHDTSGACFAKPPNAASCNSCSV